MLNIRFVWGRPRPAEKGRCPHCHYDLQGLRRARCPECGRSTLRPEPPLEDTSSPSDTARECMWLLWLIALGLLVFKSIDYYEQMRFGMLVICGFAIIGLLLPLVYKFIS